MQTTLAALANIYCLYVLDGQKRKKSLRKKLDSLGKEKNKDKGIKMYGCTETDTWHLVYFLVNLYILF